MTRRHDVIQGLAYGSAAGMLIFALSTEDAGMTTFGTLCGALVGLIPARHQVGQWFAPLCRPEAWELASRLWAIGFGTGLLTGLAFFLFLGTQLAGALLLAVTMGMIFGILSFCLGAAATFLSYLWKLLRP